MFVWLLVQGRISCRKNIFRKRIVDSTTCEVGTQGEESSEHIIRGCAIAVSFWAAIGADVPPSRPTSELHQTSRPDHIPKEQF